MKKYSCNLLRMYLLLLFSYLVQPIYAQSIYKIDSVLYVTPNLESESKEIVQEMPCFPGGQQGLMQWIDNNFQVPKEAIRDRVNGKTIVSYVVSKTGEVINVKILKSIHPAIDDAIKKMFIKMPRWAPVTENGVPVNVKYSLPINVNTY